jgi:uncharacterized glyoxalase superfamily protein PhnB
MILIPGTPPDHPKRIQLHFHVSDVDAKYEQMKQNGIEFEEPPKDMPWGWRHAYTADPVGHTVEIVSPLPDANPHFKQ